MIVGTIQIIYAASTSPGQRNFLKKKNASSSVSHMGFIIIRIGSLSDIGLNVAILQIISHGFIGAALFFLAGTSYDWIRLVYLDEMGGMAVPVPKIFMTLIQKVLDNLHNVFLYNIYAKPCLFVFIRSCLQLDVSVNVP